MPDRGVPSKCPIGGGTLSKGEWGKDPQSTGSVLFLVSLTLHLAGSPPVSVSLTLSGSPGPLPSPVTRRGARHSGLRGYWLALTPDLRLPSQFPALPLIGSVPLPLGGSFLIGAFLSISPVSSISLSLSVSVSPPWFLSVFLSPSTALSVSLHLCRSPSLCLPSSAADGSGWVQDSQARALGAGANNTPFTRPSGAMATRPPRPPRPGHACQEDAMVTSGACPPPRALLEGPGRQGAPSCSLCLESGGASSFRGLSARRCLSFPFCNPSGAGRMRS